MIIHTIPLRDEVTWVYLEAYLLQNSPQFQTDRRRPAVIVCPGGGYRFTSDREAEPVALRFLAQGYHAFVVRYSVQTPFPQPMHDLATAVQLVRANANAGHLDPDQLAVCGFSAGGHLAASLGVLWQHPWLTEPLGVSADVIRPNALILGYPVIDLDLTDNALRAFGPDGAPERPRDFMLRTVLGEADPALTERYRLGRQVSSATPPTFLWHTADDELVYAHNALRFATALADHHVPYELHIFGSGVHGLALADDTTDVEGRMINADAQVWIDLAVRWLKRQWAR